MPTEGPIHYEAENDQGKKLKLHDVRLDLSKEKFSDDAKENNVLAEAFNRRIEKIQAIVDEAKKQAYADFVETEGPGRDKEGGLTLGKRWIPREGLYNETMKAYQENLNQIYQESLNEMRGTMLIHGKFETPSLGLNFDTMIGRMANEYMATKLHGKLKSVAAPQPEVAKEEGAEKVEQAQPPDKLEGETTTEKMEDAVKIGPTLRTIKEIEKGAK